MVFCLNDCETLIIYWRFI